MIVMLSVPFALVGSVWTLWALGYNISVAVWVGLIALAGVAAEIAVILLVYLDEAYHRHERKGRLRNRAELFEAIREGAGERVRPVLMTATAVTAGLLPILWGGGTGATVIKRIAAPMVGEVVSATVLTLLVVPALYTLSGEGRRRPWKTPRIEVATMPFSTPPRRDRGSRFAPWKSPTLQRAGPTRSALATPLQLR